MRFKSSFIIFIAAYCDIALSNLDVQFWIIQSSNENISAKNACNMLFLKSNIYYIYKLFIYKLSCIHIHTYIYRSYLF